MTINKLKTLLLLSGFFILNQAAAVEMELNVDATIENVVLELAKDEECEAINLEIADELENFLQEDELDILDQGIAEELNALFQEEESPIDEESTLAIIEEIFAPEVTEEVVAEEIAVESFSPETTGNKIKKHIKVKRGTATKIAKNALDNSIHNITVFREAVRELKNSKTINKSQVRRIVGKMKKFYQNKLIKKISTVQKNWKGFSNIETKVCSKIAARVMKRIKSEFKNLDSSTKASILRNKNLFFGEVLFNVCEQSQLYMNFNNINVTAVEITEKSA